MWSTSFAWLPNLFLHLVHQYLKFKRVHFCRQQLETLNVSRLTRGMKEEIWAYLCKDVINSLIKAVLSIFFQPSISSSLCWSHFVWRRHFHWTLFNFWWRLPRKFRRFLKEFRSTSSLLLRLWWLSREEIGATETHESMRWTPCVLHGSINNIWRAQDNQPKLFPSSSSGIAW